MAKTNISLNNFNRLSLKNQRLLMEGAFGLDKDPQFTLIGQSAVLIEPKPGSSRPEVPVIWIPSKLGPNGYNWQKFLMECLQEAKRSRFQAAGEVLIFTVTDKNGNTHTFVIPKDKLESKLH